MALIFADGFDHYGTDAIFKASGAWVFSNAVPKLGTALTEKRTGDYYLSFDTFGSGLATHMFGGGRNTVGAGVAFLLPIAPSTRFIPLIFQGLTSATVDTQICIEVNNDLSISIRRGYSSVAVGTLLAQTSGGIFPTNSYSYIEALVKCDNLTGFVIVRLNENEILRVELVDTQNEPTNVINGVGIAKVDTQQSKFSFDDFIVWDETGAFNNAFLGDMRCRTLLPEANGPIQDWASTQANAFDAINNVPYDAAQNISAANVGDNSQFNYQSINDNTSYCAGIVLHTVTNKSDAGACEIVPKIVSGVASNSGPAIAMGTGDAFYKTVFETDPATGAYWTKASINDALIEYERTV